MSSVTRYRNDFVARPLDGSPFPVYNTSTMTNTDTDTVPNKNTDITRIKAPKSHKYRGIGANNVVIVGLDTDKSLHDAELVELRRTNPKFVADMSEGVWCLADDESNASPPADNLIASIKAKGEVEQAGKVIPVPLTTATRHLAYVDDAGKTWPCYFAVVYGRKRTRVDRELGTGMIFKVETGNLKSAAADMITENLVRRTFAPTVEAAKLAKLQADGFSLIEIAEKIGEHDKTPTDRTIANKLKLLNLAAPVAKLVDSGELKVTSAYAIADLPKSKQAEVASQVIGNRLTTSQTKALVREITGEKPSDGKPIVPERDEANDASDVGEQLNENDKPEKPDPKPPTPTFDSVAMTKTARPKADEIDEMIHYLGGENSPLAKRATIKLAVAMLQWVRGNMSEDELLLKVALLHKLSPEDLEPTIPNAESEGE